MQKLGKAFGDMPGINQMFAGAAGMEDKEDGEDEVEAEAPESEFLNAAMEGDVDAIKKAIADGGAGAPPVPNRSSQPIESLFSRLLLCLHS